MLADCEWAIPKPFDRSKAQDLKIKEGKKRTTVKQYGQVCLVLALKFLKKIAVKVCISKSLFLVNQFHSAESHFQDGSCRQLFIFVR